MKSLNAYLKSPFEKAKQKPQEVFVVVKPGFIDKANKIIDIFAEQGFLFKQMRTKQLTLNEVKQMYKVHSKEDFYDRLCKYMASGPCLGIIFDATGVEKPFTKTKELKEKIREMFGEDEMHNCLHSSNNKEDMDKESFVFF